VEVPKITRGGAEPRDKLRQYVGALTPLLNPGAQVTYVGTPHASDTLYDEVAASGSPRLLIPLYERHHRVRNARGLVRIQLPVDKWKSPEVYVGVGATCRPTPKYRFLKRTRELVFTEPVDGLIDIYDGSAWPERFGPDDVLSRRRGVRSINYWDSQYSLRAVPDSDVRLDPQDIHVYSSELEISDGRLKLGAATIVSCAAYWDVSTGRVGSDTSALCVVLYDAEGRVFWHVARGATGDAREQCRQVSSWLRENHVPSVCVEVNGVGAFMPELLRDQLRKDGLAVAVTPVIARANKQARILEGLEPLMSAGVLYASPEVWQTARSQLEEFNPLYRNQRDDYLDACAGALAQERVRFAPVDTPQTRLGNWRAPAVRHYTIRKPS
jgi:hypothetical protein